MPTEVDMLNQMMACTISHELEKCYAGLDEFKSFAEGNPGAALRIAWKVLTSREDPGHDDGGLCIALLETVTATAGRSSVEKLILDEWPNLSDAIRRNITIGASSVKAMSTDLGLKLFEHPDSRVEQRHHIVAGFAVGERDRNCGHLLVDLAKRIGSYPEPHRQRILERFIADVVRYYG